MKSTAAFVLSVLLLAPMAARGQTRLPAPGTHALSFALPSGGGAGFGVRKMLSGDRSAGLSVQMSYAHASSARPDGSDLAHSSYGLGVGPDLRLYRPRPGTVVPYLALRSDLAMSWGDAADTSMGLGAGAGLGVEWLPLEGMSISGETGMTLQYSHVGGDLPSSSVALSMFRSTLSLNLYF